MSINIQAISLLECNLKVVNAEAEKKFNLALTHYHDQTLTEGDTKVFSAAAAFDLMADIKDPLFSFSCVYGIRYIYDNEDELKVLPPPIVISHIISYLRELVSSMTVRLPGNAQLFFSPINTFDLWGKYQKTLPVQDSNSQNQTSKI